MKFKVGDKVHFESFSQKGVGTIVAVNDSAVLPYLVHSLDIKGGHNAQGKYVQDNINNYWFRKYQLELVASNDYITTKEFIKLVEDMGYGILHISSIIEIYDRGSRLFTLYEDCLGYSVSNDIIITNYFDDIMNIIKLYANTPLELREEPKKFTLKIPNSQWYIAKGQADTFVPIHETDYQSTLKYGDKSNTNKIDSIHFTQQEIDMLNNQEFINTLIKEEVK